MNPAPNPPGPPALLATFFPHLMLHGHSVIGDFPAIAHLPWCYVTSEVLGVRPSMLAALYLASVARNLMSVPAKA